VEEILTKSGTQFDPEVVAAFLRVLSYERPREAASGAGAAPSTNR